MTNLQQHSAFVKLKAAWKPAGMAGVIIEKHHFGEPDEIAFLPLCSACGKLIIDLRSANIEAIDDTPMPAGEIDGLPTSQLPGPVYCFHKSCCELREWMGPWKQADTVIRNDQRYEWERRIEAQPSLRERADG
jgi:hypothetical protein